MAKIATAATGQFSYTEAGSSIAAKGEEIANLAWVKLSVTGGTIISIIDKRNGSSFITFTDINGSEGYGNTLNGETSMANIYTEVVNAFNVSGGGGPSSNVTVVSSVLPTGAATEATLQLVLAALGGTGVQSLNTSVVNTSGSVTAGAYSVLMELSTDYTGNIDGVAYSGSDVQSKEFTADSGRTLPAITYTVTTGTIKITRLT